MSYRIKIVIPRKGKRTSTVEGISGSSCTQKTKWLDDLGEITHHESTDEFHEYCSTTEEAETEEAETVSTGCNDEW